MSSNDRRPPRERSFEGAGCERAEDSLMVRNFDPLGRDLRDSISRGFFILLQAAEIGI